MGLLSFVANSAGICCQFSSLKFDSVAALIAMLQGWTFTSQVACCGVASCVAFISNNDLPVLFLWLCEGLCSHLYFCVLQRQRERFAIAVPWGCVFGVIFVVHRLSCD